MERALTSQSADHWTIVVLTCRQPQTDFRMALARELAALGHEVHYVFLKRRPHVTLLGSGDEARQMSLPEFVRYMRTLSHSTRKLLIFNSTNLAFPVFSTFLRFAARGVWCLDMHDDLLYEQEGWKRRKATLAQKILFKASHFSVHAARTLVELFPRSHYLGNASDLAAIAQPKFNGREVLVLASLDGRFDFAFMTRVARDNPDLSFHIHGQVSKGSTTAQGKVATMLAAAPNILYRGPYANDDLPSLLRRYSVTLAPYAMNSALTRYIDPLRYYHCLNSGLELVTTDIPSANDLRGRLHVIREPDAFRPLMKQIVNDEGARRNAAPTRLGWGAKAVAFMDIVAHEAGEKVEVLG